MALIFSELTPEEQVAAIFIGYYDRAPAVPGLNQYVADFAAGQTPADVARSFVMQDETLALYPSLDDETISQADAEQLVTDIFNNLFNRDPAGIEEGTNTWVQQLVDGTTEVGQVILNIMSGAQGDDLLILQNKIEVATAYVQAADAAGLDGTGSLKDTVLDDIDETQASVTSAIAAVQAAFPEEPVSNPGETFPLKVGIDFEEGTENDDLFVAQIGQSEFVGGVSNTLATGDSVDGKGGNDRLFANITNEFVGTNLVDQTDIHPLIKNVEEIDIRVADSGVASSGSLDLSGLFDLVDILELDEEDEDFFDGVFESVLDGIEILFDGFNDQTVIVDGGVVGSDGVYFNGILGHEEIGSYFSDGDLVIENLTTYDANGVARNTSEITVTMDHTDNFNSDGDASDLAVLFDNDYLLAGEVTEFQIQLRIVNTLELAQNDDPLNSFDSVTFTVGDTEVTVSIEGLATYAEVRNAINAELAAQGLTGVTAVLAEDRTAIFTDDIEEFAQGDLAGTYTPVNIVSTDQELVIGPIELLSDVTDFNGLNTWVAGDEVTTLDPISVGIELHKVGRGGEGGDLIIGGKAQSTPDDGIADGIEVFNITVKGVGGSGADAKPSSLGTIASTLGALKTINIATDAVTAQGDSFASLEVRDSVGGAETINANGFLGDLTLGSDTPIVNLHTLTALGGGDVSFTGTINEQDTVYSYTTGSGEDDIDVTMDGDALDYNDSEVLIDTGAGDDEISVFFDPDTPEGGSTTTTTNSNQQLNQAILDNVRINGGADDDTITVDGIGNARIFGDGGDDIIYTDGSAAGDEGASGTTNAIWALNFDTARAAANGGIGNSDADDLPGVENTLAYIGGATVTVTLSGAGEFGLGDGGGVMSFDIAKDGVDGYEAEATVTVAGDLDHYGTQQDINNAVRAAIEGDDVLNALLEVVEGANNTLVIVSRTSGDFDNEDLRIDIAQNEVTSLAAAEAVLTEARAEFQNSALTLTDLFGQTTFSADNPGVYQADAPAGEDGDLTNSFEADDWYDGLSIKGDGTEIINTSMLNNLHTDGFESNAETDNVINGGDGDDIIVLSTDAIAGGSVAYTAGGNNAMINGASNETVVMTGEDFGDDTVMNFTTATPTAAGEDTELPVSIAQLVSGSNIDGSPQVDPQPEVFVLDVSAVPVSSTPYSVEFGSVSVNIPADATPAQIAAAIQTAFDAANDSGFTTDGTEDVSDGLVTFTSDVNEDVTPDITIDGSFISTANFLNNAVIEEDSYQQGSDTTVPAENEEFQIVFSDAPTTLGTDEQLSVTFELQASDPFGPLGPIPLTFTVTEGDTAEEIVADILAEYGDGQASDETFFTVEEGDSPDQIRIILDEDVEGTDFDLFRSVDPIITLDTFVDTVIPGEPGIAQGLDFLDFTSYLTSEFDSSSNPPGTDSDVSNQLIDVTLNYNEDNSLAGGFGDGAALGEVEANEVAVVRMTDDTDDTFAGLSEADVAALFNSNAATADFANLAAATFDVIDSQSDDAVVNGDAKAIFMVEDGGNLGHYKVFELSWDASEDDGDEGVVAEEIGSLDFGTSLTDLDDVNLVGSDDYALLNDIGILNYV